MSHRISLKRGKMLYEKEQELQELQKLGRPLPKSNRRQKKYLMQVRKQKGFFKYLSARYKLHGHFKKAEALEEER